MRALDAAGHVGEEPLELGLLCDEAIVDPGAGQEGVGAFAEPGQKRIVAPIDDPPDRLYGLIVHELTHQFEFDIIPRTLLRRGLPLWVDEGLTDFMTGYWNPFDLMSVRDAAIADIIPPMSDFQGVQFMLADMATQVDASRLLIYRACARLDAGRTDIASASSMGKLFASDTAMRVATDCVQLLGGVLHVNGLYRHGFLIAPRLTELIMKIIRLQQVMEMTGLGRSTVYKYVSGSLFPKPIPLGGRSVGWLESEVKEWILDRIEERDMQGAVSV